MARQQPLARARQCRRGLALTVLSARYCASKGQPRRPILLILTRLRWHLGAAFTRLRAVASVDAASQRTPTYPPPCRGRKRERLSLSSFKARPCGFHFPPPERGRIKEGGAGRNRCVRFSPAVARDQIGR